MELASISALRYTVRTSNGPRLSLQLIFSAEIRGSIPAGVAVFCDTLRDTLTWISQIGPVGILQR